MLVEPEKKKATHHLTSMKVDEVSFVSSGANGRNKWLLAKAAEGEPLAVDAQQANDAPAAPQTAGGPEPTPTTETIPAPISEQAPAAAPTATAVKTEQPQALAAPDPDPELLKTQAARLQLHRQVWALIHREVDGILAGLAAPATETVVATESTASEPIESTEPASKQTPPVVEATLPDAIMRALEQVPALVAEVQAQKAALTKLAGQRMGPTALPVEGMGVSLEPANPWAGVYDLAEEVVKKRQSRR